MNYKKLLSIYLLSIFVTNSMANTENFGCKRYTNKIYDSKDKEFDESVLIELKKNNINLKKASEKCKKGISKFNTIIDTAIEIGVASNSLGMLTQFNDVIAKECNNASSKKELMKTGLAVAGIVAGSLGLLPVGAIAGVALGINALLDNVFEIVTSMIY